MFSVVLLNLTFSAYYNHRFEA